MPRRQKKHSRLFRALLILKALTFCAMVSVLSLFIACGTNEPRWDNCDSPMIASDASSFMTGEMLYLDGGMSRIHGVLG